MTRAYGELRTCRQSVVYTRTAKGGGVGSFSIPGPIPWSAMLEWCRWHQLTRDVTNHVIAVLSVVDQMLRKIAIDKTKQK